ncbi:MAG: hypothetical protein ABGY95_06020 [Rubritalea sp.]|uniref:hypothetical protein n=1 Tax=Rubritalea sp. TaxID=2109375 RepID=UPI003242B27F
MIKTFALAFSALLTTAFAKLPAEIAGSWVLDSEATEKFIQTSPKWDAEGAKYLPSILKRMSMVEYTFEEGTISASMRGKSQEIPATLVKSEGNVHVFEIKMGEKTFTITATINKKGQLNMRASNSDDGDYYLWTRGKRDGAKDVSDHELATEVIEKALEEEEPKK